MEFEIVGGKRRNSNLLYSVSEKQLYAKKSAYKNKIYYTCYQEKCKSRLILEAGVCTKCFDFVEHKHGNQEEMYKELKALNNIKRKCTEVHSVIGEANALSGIKNLFQEISASDQDSTKNIDFSKIQRGLQYISSAFFEISPKTPSEVVHALQKDNINKHFGMSLHQGNDHKKFFTVCHVQKDFSYCIFISAKTVLLIEENIPSNSNRTILVDGTFAVVPLGCFKQLVMVHIQFSTKIFPFVFILTDRKSTKCYEHFFKYINDNVLDLNGATFVTDYEISLRTAIMNVFPKSKVIGCWFHFCQAVKRHIITKCNQLAAFIRQNKKASLEYHKLLALPLLPPAYIDTSFVEIKGEIEKFDQNLKFETFLQYYENQWLRKIGPEGISVYGTCTRTTSALEAYNGVLGRMISKNGNFFKFVRVLQKEELNKSREFDLLVNSGGGCVKAKRKRQIVFRNAKIEQGYNDLRTGKITAAIFLNRMAFPKNDICTGMEPDEDLFEAIEYIEVEDDDINISEPPQGPTQRNLCIVCLISEANTVLIPCKHLKLCNECVLKLQAEAIGSELQTYNCPICRAAVDDVIQVFM